MQMIDFKSFWSLEAWSFLNAEELWSYSPLSRRWRSYIFNLSRLQWNQVFDNKGPSFLFPDKEEAYAFWNVVWMVLYFIFFVWMSFVLKSRCPCMILNLWWCQLPALQLCHVSSVLGLTYVIPLNRTNVDALVLWISLMPLAVLGVWGPLKALSTSPSIRIRTRVKYVQSGWLHRSAFFFSTQLIQGSPGQRQHLFFFFSNFQIFSPFFLSLIVLRNYMLINR